MWVTDSANDWKRHSATLKITTCFSNKTSKTVHQCPAWGCHAILLTFRISITFICLQAFLIFSNACYLSHMPIFCVIAPEYINPIYQAKLFHRPVFYMWGFGIMELNVNQNYFLFSYFKHTFFFWNILHIHCLFKWNLLLNFLSLNLHWEVLCYLKTKQKCKQNTQTHVYTYAYIYIYMFSCI